MTINVPTQHGDFFEDLGGILAEYHGNHHVDPSDSSGYVDTYALNFAGYLQAARCNAGLSVQELAQQAELSEAEVFALERALILSTEILSSTLYALAKALDEDIDDFALLLEREIPKPDLEGMPARLQNGWNAARVYLGSTSQVLIVVCLMVMALGASVVLVRNNDQVPLPAFIPFLFDRRYSLSMVMLLFFLFIWVAIWRGELPFKLVPKLYRWERPLVYATPLILLCVLVVASHSTNASVYWSSEESLGVQSIAWGDVDNDGDLNLAVGTENSSPSVLYRNEAGILSATPAWISNELDYSKSVAWGDVDGDGDLDLAVSNDHGPPNRVYLNQGGTLSASANWSSTDAVSTLSVAWGDVDDESPSFRVAAPQYVKVVNDSGNAVADATVYAYGQPVGTTDQAGLLNPDTLANGTALVALVQQAEQSTMRAAHNGWAYRTYLTSLVWDAAGQGQPFIVNGKGEQRLVVRRAQPLVLFNLVVSIEWDADDGYIQQIERAMDRASDYVYDFTDGQMAFSQVAIYDKGEHWVDADIQISTKNIVHPHAYIGGITSSDTAHVIRLGRGWDGHSGNQGAWDQPEGYRTLAHEFGHYALHRYDEYFGYRFDGHGNLLGEAAATCTGPENCEPATDATNASVMDYQYNSSELSARGVPGLWSSHCEQTAQCQLNPGESDWETLVRKYADTDSPPRWQFTTPLERGGVLAGPDRVPAFSPTLIFTQSLLTGGGAPRLLTVQDAQGPHRNTIVALYKQTGGRVLSQGFTDSNGQLAIYGAPIGDIVRASSFEGRLAGSVTVEDTTALTLTLYLVQIGQAAGVAAQTTSALPHIQVRTDPDPDSSQVDLLVSLNNFGPGADPTLLVTEPGSEVGYASTLAYRPGSDEYEGQFSVSAMERGTGHIRVAGAVGDSLMRLQSTYRLQRVVNGLVQDVYSDDGNLNLHMGSDSFPVNEVYLVVMPPGVVPGAVSDFTGSNETPWPDILFAISRSVLMMILFSIIGMVVIREGKIRWALTKSRESRKVWVTKPL